MCEAVIAIFQWFQFWGHFLYLESRYKNNPPNIPKYWNTWKMDFGYLVQRWHNSQIWVLSVVGRFFFIIITGILDVFGASSSRWHQLKVCKLRPKRFQACAREPMLDAQGWWCRGSLMFTGSKLSGKIEKGMEIFEGFPISFHSTVSLWRVSSLVDFCLVIRGNKSFKCLALIADTANFPGTILSWLLRGWFSRVLWCKPFESSWIDNSGFPVFSRKAWCFLANSGDKVWYAWK